MIKKIADYKAELDLRYERMLSFSKLYVIFQILITLITAGYWLLVKNPHEFSVFNIPLGFWIYIIVHTWCQIVVSMYIKDKNPDIYAKYTNPWRVIGKYYPLRNIILRKLKPSDFNEIQDDRIVQLIYAKLKADKVLIICEVILVSLILLKGYKVF